jgi:predicted alpha/beta superfamily hydrolase
MVASFRTSLFVIGLSISLVASGCAQKDQKSCSSLLDGVTLPDTEVKALKSSSTGRNYDIYIRFPSEYAQNKGKKYPVLYVLDGQWDFKLLDSIYGGLLYDGFVPEMIIVGITYSGPNPDYNALRAMDYTPVRDPSILDSGGAPQFLAFFKEELIPFIEANYPADPSQRVLMGSSFGGSFTLYAMFAEPDLFSGYVAASPVVVYGQRFAFTQEAQYANDRHDLPVRLFLSVGELEDLAQPVQEFAQIVRGRGYTGLKLETQTIEGERHSGNKPEAFNRGLRFIFQNK